MKHFRIFHALTNVKEEYIQEAAPPGKPKRQWWKAGAGLAACLCLVAALVTVPFGGRGSCENEPPGWEYSLTASPDGQSVYFCYEDVVYRHTPGDKHPTKLTEYIGVDVPAEFNGTFRQTETGFYCIDQDTGDVYRVEGTQLFHLGTIPVNENVIRQFQFISYENDTIYWSCREHYDDPEYVVYATECIGSQTLRLFSTPAFGYSEISYREHMVDGSIYFMAKGGILQRYDLETREVSVVYNHFWSMKAEPWEWYFFEDFVLCRCIQYAPNQEGTHDQVGHPFYVLPYDGSDAYFLTDCTNYHAAPLYAEDTLYYLTILDVSAPQRDILPVACDPVTGDLTPLADQELGEHVFNIALCGRDLYYTADYDLWCYDLTSGQPTRILDWKD